MYLHTYTSNIYICVCVCVSVCVREASQFHYKSIDLIYTSPSYV